MTTNVFFDETSEQSLAKATIVANYFWAWAKVIIPSVKRNQGRIAYIDLFAGPGRYKDGTRSTPLLVLETAIKDEDMRQMLVSVFNDVDKNNSQSLREAIDALPGINTLKYKPEVQTQEVGEEIVKMFEKMHLVPTLFFVDPWGYKGLSLRLVNSVLKDWGCDCIFFFNYNRINMGLNNKAVEEHMNALFGKERADNLRDRLNKMQPPQRELAVVEDIAQALKEMGGKYVLPFRFRTNTGNRTSHHLIFVSKHFKGYEIMKNIMAGESTKANQGVPSFEYSPADVLQPLLFELSRPLDDLADMLLTEYAGKRLTVRQVYEEHNVGRPYILKNYKDVIKKLEADGKVTAYPPSTNRRKRKGEITLADTVEIAFPPRSN
jgi:three-Cys-motif partner protein